MARGRNSSICVVWSLPLRPSGWLLDWVCTYVPGTYLPVFLKYSLLWFARGRWYHTGNVQVTSFQEGWSVCYWRACRPHIKHFGVEVLQLLASYVPFGYPKSAACTQTRKNGALCLQIQMDSFRLFRLVIKITVVRDLLRRIRKWKCTLVRGKHRRVKWSQSDTSLGLVFACFPKSHAS